MINRAFARAIRITVAFVGGVVFSYLCWVQAILGGVYLMNFLRAWFLPGQAIFDVVLVLLGIAAIQRLLAYKVSSNLGRIARGVTVFLLGAAAVIIPAIYSVIWFLSAHALAKSAAQVHGARPGWISVVAGLVSAGFAILTARHSSEVRSQPQMNADLRR